MTTVIYEGKPVTFASPPTVAASGLWVSRADLGALDWEPKPEGICRGDVCVPIPAGKESSILGEGEAFNLTGFADLIEQPYATDGDIWYFGEPGWQWKNHIESRTAPDFELLDFAGKPHRLSDHRGQKVILVCWASWCGCRFDLPVWSELRDELHAQGLEIITVDTDSKGIEAGRPFVDEATPMNPTLFDGNHLVPELFNTKNVPAAFWIDEQGTIVRANDPIYARRRNPETQEWIVNTRYQDAIRDWVAKGPDSEFVAGAPGLDSVEEQTWENMEGLAHFRLGLYLQEQGQTDQAIAQFKEAHRLAPGNYNYRRQAYNLGNIKDDYGYETMRDVINEPGAPAFYRQVDIVNMAR
ncbi:MAG: redoxin domain-containing protein [Chloroflexota bacterium]